MNTVSMGAADCTARLSEQASHWWVVLHGENVLPSERREFGEWVARSPERVAAYLEAEMLMRALKSSGVRWPDVGADALIREAKAAAPEPLPFSLENSRASANRVQSGSSRLFLSSIAASLIALVTAAWLFLAGPQRYQTALGEQRSVLLDDGSLVTLNTASRIKVDLDEDRRLIRLISGEALFEVAHDAARPFDVEAGTATFRAVGTQFNVDRRPAGTTITVVEGRVAVISHLAGKEATQVAPRSQGADTRERTGAMSPAAPENVSSGKHRIILAAAQRLIVTDSHLGTPEPIVNLAAATAWTQRRLIFERRPLAEVAAEFNRYNRETIRIDDAELQREQVTGVFQANDPESFMTFLAQIPGVKIHQTGAGDHVVTANEQLAPGATATN